MKNRAAFSNVLRLLGVIGPVGFVASLFGANPALSAKLGNSPELVTITVLGSFFSSAAIAMVANGMNRRNSKNQDIRQEVVGALLKSVESAIAATKPEANQRAESTG